MSEPVGLHRIAAQLTGGGTCNNCGQPFAAHCTACLIPCCPGKCHSGRCAVDWRAFGLEPEHSCSNAAEGILIITCAHEHVARSPACRGCAALMESYGPDWHCPACYPDHPCDAPLMWLPGVPA